MIVFENTEQKISEAFLDKKREKREKIFCFEQGSVLNCLGVEESERF